jgi:hypothetical protein
MPAPDRRDARLLGELCALIADPAAGPAEKASAARRLAELLDRSPELAPAVGQPAGAGLGRRARLVVCLDRVAEAALDQVEEAALDGLEELLRGRRRRRRVRR